MGCALIKETQKKTRVSEEFKHKSPVILMISNQVRMKKKGLYMVKEVAASLEFSTHKGCSCDSLKISE